MLRFTRSRHSLAATCCFWLVCSLLAVALAFPTLFVVLDHHGVERLPTHFHVGSAGGIAEAHAHMYDVGHLHAMSVETVDPGIAIVVRAASQTSWFVVYALLGFILPTLGTALVRQAGIRWRFPGGLVAASQILAGPPTPPPTILLAHS